MVSPVFFRFYLVRVCGIIYPYWLLTYSVIAGVWDRALATGNLNNILKFFPDRRGLASGIVLAGVGVGTLLAPTLAEYLWRKLTMLVGRLLYLGIVYLVVIFIVSSFIRSAPAKDSGERLKRRHWIKTIGTC